MNNLEGIKNWNRKEQKVFGGECAFFGHAFTMGERSLIINLHFVLVSFWA